MARRTIEFVGTDLKIDITKVTAVRTNPLIAFEEYDEGKWRLTYSLELAEEFKDLTITFSEQEVTFTRTVKGMQVVETNPIAAYIPMKRAERMIYLDKLNNGKWTVKYTASLFEDFRKVTSINVIRED